MVYSTCEIPREPNDQAVRTLPIDQHHQALNGYRVETFRQALHRILNPSEHPHATRPSLNMLAQRAKRDELDAAIRFRTSIYLLVVARALQVLIQAVECLERRVAQEALVLQPVPRALRGPRGSAHRRLVLAWRPTNQPRGVRNEVILVRSHDEAVELLARHARPAGPGLKVERERCWGDKRLVAFAARAQYIARTVQFGV